VNKIDLHNWIFEDERKMPDRLNMEGYSCFKWTVYLLPLRIAYVIRNELKNETYYS
jgi:hypothetical protein